MTDWGDDTPWRQGHLLPKEIATKLGKAGSASGDQIAMIISHDCDLSQSPINEPYIEVVLGYIIDSLNGSLTNAKSTRVLHIPLTAGTETVNLCLEATKKSTIAKELLADLSPSDKHRLSGDDRRKLQQWLARRYRRSAFPNAFNDRLKTSKADRKISEKLTPYGTSIHAIFFTVDDGEDIERSNSDDTYSLGITIVYDGSDAINNERKATALKGELEAIFSKAFFNQDTRGWVNIELIYCEVASDMAVSVAQARTMSEWNVDHISLRDPSNPPLYED